MTQASARIGDQIVESRLTPTAYGLIAVFGDIVASVQVATIDGQPVRLPADGVLRVQRGQRVVIVGERLAANAEVSVWMYSEPQLLDVTRTTGTGLVRHEQTIGDDVSPGDHHLVLSSINEGGESVVIAMPFNYPSTTANGVVSRVAQNNLIWWLLGVVLVAALLLPTRLRRRRLDMKDAS